MIIPQSTRYQHNYIIEFILFVPKLVACYPKSLSSTDSVLCQNSKATDNFILRLLLARVVILLHMLSWWIIMGKDPAQKKFDELMKRVKSGEF